MRTYCLRHRAALRPWGPRVNRATAVARLYTSARRALFFRHRSRFLGIRHAGADIHEAAGLRRVVLAPPVRMSGKTGARRNQPTDDDVFLQAAQVVLEAAHRGFGQHARGLLEGSRRDERLGGQRSLRDAEQHGLQARRLLATARGPIVDRHRPRAIELFAAQQRGITDAQDLGLAQHLADDHLDVLVIDLHALQPVNVLDLAHQVVGERLDALQAQDVVRIGLTIGDDLAALDLLALEHVELPPFRNQLFVLLAMLIRDHEAPLALGLLAEADRTGLLRQNRRILGLARLEQVRHAGQTAGDVAGLGRFLRDARDDVADRDLGAVRQVHQGTRGQVVDRRNDGVGEGDFLALG